MEEKESTFSGSPGNSGSDSAPVSNAVTQAVNVGINAGVEGGFGSNVAVTAITLSSGGGTAGNVDSFGKKKRGRPRKYDADGNLRVPYAGASPPAGSFSLTPGSPSELSSKRGRGRPPGSGNWQLLASLGELFANTAGGDFTPHVVTVTTGEDVAGKILSFTQKGPRGVCVLSANGAVSNVTIRQPGSSGGILTYEGRFEILSLSGSFTVSDTSGARGRTTGGLSVSLAGPDGRVIGGGIAGLLTAASPIQIVVGSFMPNGYKVHKKKHYREYAVTSPHPPPPATDTPTMASPISQAKPVGFEASSTGPPPVTIPAHQSNLEAQKSAGENIIPSSNCAGWNGSESKLNYGQSPDINLSVPFE